MALRIVDVSRHQGGPIDWQQVRAAVDGVIIRLGVRGWKYNKIVIDTCALRNIKGAERAGIPWGVYFFSQAINAQEGQEEAAWTVARLQELAAQGLKPLYPVFIDSELSGAAVNIGRADHISREARTAAIKAFCETAQRAGYYAGIYAGRAWFKTQLNDSELEPFAHWVAHWTDRTGPAYAGRFGIWQYTNFGTCAGIGGRVDLNRGYINYPKIIRENGLNGWSNEPKPEPEPRVEPFSRDPVGVVIGPASAGDAARIEKVLKDLLINWKEEDDGTGKRILTDRVSKGDQITLIKLARRLKLNIEPYQTATEAPEDEPRQGKPDTWAGTETPPEGPETPQDEGNENQGSDTTTGPDEPGRPRVGPLSAKIIIRVLRYIIKLFGGGSVDD